MEKQIKLDEKSAQEFVSAASRCNFDIDVLDVYKRQHLHGSRGTGKSSEGERLFH